MLRRDPVYLDHAATTPLRPEAIDAVTRALRVVGNPSSIHSAGQEAKRLLEESREEIAATVGAVMPPTSSTQLNDAEKEAFTKWGCCDGPQ